MGFLPINVAGVAPAEDFVYPAGEYILQVDPQGVKVQPTKDGQGFRMVVKSKIVMGPNASLDLQGKPFTHSFPLTENSRMFVVQFAHACGLEAQIAQNGGNIAEEWFPGRQYVAFVSQKDGYFNASKIRPLDAWTHGGIAGQPAAGPQGVGGAQPTLLQPMPSAPVAAPQAPQQFVQQPGQQQLVQPGQPQQFVQPQPGQGFVPGQPQPPQMPTPQMPPQQQFVQPQQMQQPQQFVQPGTNGAPQAQPGLPAPQAGMPAPPPPGQIPGQ